jgi:hypothetical protein
VNRLTARFAALCFFDRDQMQTRSVEAYDSIRRRQYDGTSWTSAEGDGPSAFIAMSAVSSSHNIANVPFFGDSTELRPSLTPYSSEICRRPTRLQMTTASRRSSVGDVSFAVTAAAKDVFRPTAVCGLHSPHCPPISMTRMNADQNVDGECEHQFIDMVDDDSVSSCRVEQFYHGGDDGASTKGARNSTFRMVAMSTAPTSDIAWTPLSLRSFTNSLAGQTWHEQQQQQQQSDSVISTAPMCFDHGSKIDLPSSCLSPPSNEGKRQIGFQRY